MQRVALLVDGWNLLKSAERVDRRINFEQLRNIVMGAGREREIVFQRFYMGPPVGLGMSEITRDIEREVTMFGYECVFCVTENPTPKTAVDAYIIMDMLTYAYCRSVDVIALCSGDAGYAEAIRRIKVLGLRVEVYAIKSNGHFPPALEQNAHSIRDLASFGVFKQNGRVVVN